MSRDIEDDEFVTQYGNLAGDPAFRTRPPAGSPRPRTMSVTLGRRSPEEMVRLVRRSPDPASDTARHARVRRFREAGFLVRHTPTSRNLDHASVEWAGEWEDTVAERFDSCFEDDDE